VLFGWFGARKDGVEEGGEAVDGFGGNFWRGGGISGGGGMMGGRCLWRWLGNDEMKRGFLKIRI